MNGAAKNTPGERELRESVSPKRSGNTRDPFRNYETKRKSTPGYPPVRIWLVSAVKALEINQFKVTPAASFDL